MRRSRIERKTRLRSTGRIRSSRGSVTRSAPSRSAKKNPELDWPSARRVALERDLYRCVRCDALAAEVHHRRLKGIGGSSHPDRDRPDRLISLCTPCHGWVHGARNRLPAEAAGWIVRRTDDTLTTPVQTRRGLVLLTVDARTVPVQRAA